MTISTVIKFILTWAICARYHIRKGKNDYLGLGLKIINLGGVLLGSDVIIRPHSHIYIDPNSELTILNGAEIGRESTITASHKIIIGRNVLTGPRVFISDHNHQYEDPSMAISKQGIRMSPSDSVVIDDDTWIGTNAVIVGNVHIGKHCVIGANSVVNKDIPDYCVAVGAPARIIRKFNFSKKCWERI